MMKLQKLISNINHITTIIFLEIERLALSLFIKFKLLFLLLLQYEL